MTNHGSYSATEDSALRAQRKEEWRGGECPVASGTRIWFWFRVTPETRESSDRPEFLRWTHKNWHGDIIAYQVCGDVAVASNEAVKDIKSTVGTKPPVEESGE